MNNKTQQIQSKIQLDDVNEIVDSCSTALGKLDTSVANQLIISASKCFAYWLLYKFGIFSVNTLKEVCTAK